jgi:hypothetical protein
MSTVVDDHELFFYQPDPASAIDGHHQFVALVDDVFMPDDFRAIRTEIENLRLSPSLVTAWFSCILNDYNEFRGEPAVWENVRWTGVPEKTDGRWRIMQQHSSKARGLAG